MDFVLEDAQTQFSTYASNAMESFWWLMKRSFNKKFGAMKMLNSIRKRLFQTTPTQEREPHRQTPKQTSAFQGRSAGLMSDQTSRVLNTLQATREAC